MRDAILIAEEDLNAAGGVLGCKVKVVIADTEGLPEKAAAVMDRLQPDLLPVLGEQLRGKHRAAVSGVGGAHVELRALQPRLLEVVLRLVHIVGDLQTRVVARELRAERLN